jgi:hypothetical protein
MSKNTCLLFFWQAWNLTYVLGRAVDSDARILLAQDLCAGQFVASEAALLLIPSVNSASFQVLPIDAVGALSSGMLHPCALLLHRFWRETCASLETQVWF